MKTTSKNVGYQPRDYWIQENLRYRHPYFRTIKIGNIINRLSRGLQCDLLDLGCGPETLSTLLQPNISYFGIDIAIQNQRQNLLELDVVHNPIHFKGRSFDFVVAAGLLEYLGDCYEIKYAEIQKLLKPNGIFVATYMNMEHCANPSFPTWNYRVTIDDFRKSLGSYFKIHGYFPSYYSKHLGDLDGALARRLQLYFNVNLPLVGKKYGVNYIFICSPKQEA